jgi:hypothetical protein
MRAHMLPEPLFCELSVPVPLGLELPCRGQTGLNAY